MRELRPDFSQLLIRLPVCRAGVPAAFLALSGLVVGCGSNSSSEPLQYSIETLGLTDAAHTADDGTRINLVNRAEGVYVTGTAYRRGDASNGYSTWIYDGESTTRIGFYDGEHDWGGGNGRTFGAGLTDSGYAIGYSYRGGAAGPTTAWLYDGVDTLAVGLFDVSSDNFPNDVSTDGQVVGYASGDGRRVAWYYDGATYHALGFTGGQYTAEGGGESSNSGRLLGDGRVSGISASYFTDGGNLYSNGSTTWIWRAGEYTITGLFDSLHTREANGYQRSRANRNLVASGEDYINSEGQVIGVSDAFSDDDVISGFSAWLFDGTSSLRIGFYDTEHTNINDQGSTSFARALDEAGRVAGESLRYDASGASNGQSVWLYDSGSITNIGLITGEHTSDSGERHSQVTAMNENGQVAGTAANYSLGREGRSSWFYDGNDTSRVGIDGSAYSDAVFGFIESTGSEISFLTETGLIGGAAWVTAWTGPPDCAGFICFAPRVSSVAWYDNGESVVAFDGFGADSNGGQWSAIQFITEDGVVLGTYRSFDELGNDLGEFVFIYTEESGVADLQTFVDDSFDDQMWASLSSVVTVNDEGVIFGNGKLLDGSTMAFRLTPVE